MGKFDQTSGAARPQPARRKKSGGGTLLGIFIGLVIGGINTVAGAVIGGLFDHVHEQPRPRIARLMR